HLDVRPTFGSEPADGVAITARRLRPVDRPRHRLQQRGLARAVRPEDPGDAGAELDVGGLVLAEVRQAQAPELHQVAPSRPACSTYSTPRRTKTSRPRSASSRLRVRDSRSTMGGVMRRPSVAHTSVRRIWRRRTSRLELVAHLLWAPKHA